MKLTDQQIVLLKHLFKQSLINRHHLYMMCKSMNDYHINPILWSMQYDHERASYVIWVCDVLANMIFNEDCDVLRMLYHTQNRILGNAYEMQQLSLEHVNFLQKQQQIWCKVRDWLMNMIEGYKNAETTF